MAKQLLHQQVSMRLGVWDTRARRTVQFLCSEPFPRRANLGFCLICGNHWTWPLHGLDFAVGRRVNLQLNLVFSKHEFWPSFSSLLHPSSLFLSTSIVTCCFIWATIVCKGVHFISWAQSSCSSKISRYVFRGCHKTRLKRQLVLWIRIFHYPTPVCISSEPPESCSHVMAFNDISFDFLLHNKRIAALCPYNGVCSQNSFQFWCHQFVCLSQRNESGGRTNFSLKGRSEEPEASIPRIRTSSSQNTIHKFGSLELFWIHCWWSNSQHCGLDLDHLISRTLTCTKSWVNPFREETFSFMLFPLFGKKPWSRESILHDSDTKVNSHRYLSVVKWTKVTMREWGERQASTVFFVSHMANVNVEPLACWNWSTLNSLHASSFCFWSHGRQVHLFGLVFACVLFFILWAKIACWGLCEKSDIFHKNSQCYQVNARCVTPYRRSCHNIRLFAETEHYQLNTFGVRNQ